jgi:hypothetical protein
MNSCTHHRSSPSRSTGEWPGASREQSDGLNVTVQGHLIHEDASGPTTFINPPLILGNRATGGKDRHVTKKASPREVLAFATIRF